MPIQAQRLREASSGLLAKLLGSLPAPLAGVAAQPPYGIRDLTRETA
jgi:hypothetical protein